MKLKIILEPSEEGGAKKLANNFAYRQKYLILLLVKESSFNRFINRF